MDLRGSQGALLGVLAGHRWDRYRDELWGVLDGAFCLGGLGSLEFNVFKGWLLSKDPIK